MKTLTELFLKDKDDLRLRLNKFSEEPLKVIEIIQAEISRLASIEGEYITNLSLSQAPVAMAFLTTLNTTLSLSFKNIIIRDVHKNLLDENLLVKIQKTIEQFIKEQPALEFFDKSKNVKIAAATVVGGFGVGGFSTFIFWLLETIYAVYTVPLAIALIGSTSIGLTSSLLSFKVFESSSSSIDSSIDIDKLLFEIEQQLADIDYYVTKYDEISIPSEVQVDPKLEDHLDVLEYLQELMGAFNTEKGLFDLDLPSSPIFTGKRLEQISAILGINGIQVKSFQPTLDIKKIETEGNIMFEFQPSLDKEQKEYRTLKPALIKGNKVIRKGLVAEPTL